MRERKTNSIPVTAQPIHIVIPKMFPAQFSLHAGNKKSMSIAGRKTNGLAMGISGSPTLGKNIVNRGTAKPSNDPERINFKLGFFKIFT